MDRYRTGSGVASETHHERRAGSPSSPSGLRPRIKPGNSAASPQSAASNLSTSNFSSLQPAATGIGLRGAAYATLALVAFVLILLTFILPITLFSATVGNSVQLGGELNLWSSCSSFEDCTELPCLRRDICIKSEDYLCHNQARAQVAAQAIGVLTLLSIVPSIVFGALDALNKLPSVGCLRSRGLLVVKGLGSTAINVVYGALLYHLIFSEHCEIEVCNTISCAASHFGAPLYLVWVAAALNLTTALAGGCVPANRDSMSGHDRRLMQMQEHGWLSDDDDQPARRRGDEETTRAPGERRAANRSKDIEHFDAEMTLRRTSPNEFDELAQSGRLADSVRLSDDS